MTDRDQARDRPRDEPVTIGGTKQVGKEAFQSAFESHAAVMFVVDLTSLYIVDVNKAALKFYGYDRATMLTMRIPDLNIVPEPEIRAEIKRAFDEGRSYFQFKHRLANGEIRDVEIYANPISIQGKDFTFSMIHDITDRCQAEVDLQKSKILLESSIESPKDMIILSLDREYRYYYFNKTHADTMEYVYGTRPKVGKCIFDYMTLEVDIEDAKDHYGRAITGESHVSIKKYGDGQSCNYYETQYSPIYDKENEIIGVTAFARDISERIQAEKMLIAERDRANNILEGTNAGTWVWNIKTGELIINNRWAEIIGYSLEELKPIDVQTWIKNVHPDDLVLAQTQLDLHFSGKQNYYDVEFRQPHKDGTFVWVHARGKLIEWTTDGDH